jgi:hypothetical protein
MKIEKSGKGNGVFSILAVTAILLTYFCFASAQNADWCRLSGANPASLTIRDVCSFADLDLNGKFESRLNPKPKDLLPLPPAVLDTGDVVHYIPAPGSRCQGLTWDGDNLWVSDYDTDFIYKVSPDDGTVLESFPAPDEYIEGLAWDGTYLWAAENGGGPSEPSTIYQVDVSDGSVVHSFTPPGPWPHGITWDGHNLWIDDFDTKMIDKVDPSTGQVLATIPAPGDGSIGLTWDGVYLWSDDFQTDSLYQIDPADGTVIRDVRSPDTNPRDLAWDGQYVWVLSWQAATIYQVDVGTTTPTEADDTPPRAFALVDNFPNPFNARTIINYALPAAVDVTIEIYDILGRKVEMLLQGEQPAGYHQVVWDASDYPSGMYFYRIRAGEHAEIRKMVVVK